jgi:hypothetical protein
LELPQHITRRYSEAEMEQLPAPTRRRKPSAEGEVRNAGGCRTCFIGIRARKSMTYRLVAFAAIQHRGLVWHATAIADIDPSLWLSHKAAARIV